MGADVLRFERRNPPQFGAITPPLGPLDRGKHSLELNLKDADVREMLIDLVCSAEVFVEGYRPGVADRRLGIGPDDLQQRHPALIYGRMTGWGQTGPLAFTAATTSITSPSPGCWI